MATKARTKKGRAKRRKPNPNEHNGSLVRVYTRVDPKVKRAFEKIAREDDRSAMQYLRLMIEREVKQHTKGK